MNREIGYAWAGGFLDADGTFALCKVKHRPRAKNPVGPHYHRPTMRVTQVGHSGPAEKLQRLFGGRIRTTSRCEVIWTTENINEIASVIRRLLPHLVRKHPEAQLLLAYCEGPGRPQERYKIPADIWAARESLANEMVELKKNRARC